MKAALNGILVCLSLTICYCSFAQSSGCAIVDSMVVDVTNNNNGTYDYTFHVYIKGNANAQSVSNTIYSVNDTAVSASCEATTLTQKKVTYGPYTYSYLDSFYLNWKGYKNANCVGTSCDSLLFASLPVQWLSIGCEYSNGSITLIWEVGSEESNRGFDIQWFNGTVWESIGWVDGRGTAFSSYKYHYSFKAMYSGYVRIRQIDFNGNISFSNTVLCCSPKDDLSMSIVNAGESIQFNSHLMTLRVYNSMGVLVSEACQVSSMDLSSLAPDIYIFSASTSSFSKVFKYNKLK